VGTVRNSFAVPDPPAACADCAEELIPERVGIAFKASVAAGVVGAFVPARAMVVRFDPFDATVLEPCAGFGATAAPATSGREGARNDVPGDRTGFDAPDASTDAGSAATGAGSCGTSGGVVAAAVSAVSADSVE